MPPGPTATKTASQGPETENSQVCGDGMPGCYKIQLRSSIPRRAAVLMHSGDVTKVFHIVEPSVDTPEL